MSVSVLLLEDNTKGKKGEIISVKPGYWRNYLLPQKKAILADKNAVRRQKKLQEQRKQQAVEDKKFSEELAQQLKQIVLQKQMKVDEMDHLYGSISSSDIAQLLQERKISIEKHSIQLAHPIKKLGTYEISIKLKEGIASKVTLQITKEEE